MMWFKIEGLLNKQNFFDCSNYGHILNSLEVLGCSIYGYNLNKQKLKKCTKKPRSCWLFGTFEKYTFLTVFVKWVKWQKMKFHFITLKFAYF